MPEPPLDFIRRNASTFTHVGSVVATYRTRAGRRFGPYYRLIYRQDRRQRSRYLGPSQELADQVRQLLTELQQPRDDRVALHRADRLRKANLLQVKRQFQQVARAYGLQPHGWAVRGFRALGWSRIDKGTPRKTPPSPCRNQISPQQPAVPTSQPQSGSHLPSATPSVSPAVPHSDEILPDRTTRCPTRARPLAQPANPKVDRSCRRRLRPHHRPPPIPTRYCPIGPRAAQLAITTIRSRGPPGNKKT